MRYANKLRNEISKCNNNINININHLDSLVWMLSKNTYIHFILNKKEKVKKLKIEELSIIEKKLNSIDTQYKKNKTLIDRANMLYLNGSIDDDCYNNRINQLKKDKLNIDNNNKLNYINQINKIKQSIIILNEEDVESTSF